MDHVTTFKRNFIKRERPPRAPVKTYMWCPRNQGLAPKILESHKYIELHVLETLQELLDDPNQHYTD